MQNLLSAPQTQAQRARDILLGSLVALARATVNEPKTEDTDRVLRMGLMLAAKPEAGERELTRANAIVQSEKHLVAPNCATCTMRCGNTDDYDMARLWAAPAQIRELKLRLLQSMFELAAAGGSSQKQEIIDQGLFVLAEDWDTGLLLPVVQRAEAACADK